MTLLPAREEKTEKWKCHHVESGLQKIQNSFLSTAPPTEVSAPDQEISYWNDL